MFNADPVYLHSSIAAVLDTHPKTFGRMGISRPTGAQLLGMAATGRLAEMAASETEASAAEVILTGDALTDLPADTIAQQGTGKNARKLSTYTLVGLHVAAVLGWDVKAIQEAATVPGMTPAAVQKRLFDALPKARQDEIEAARKARAKEAADVAAVRQRWEAAKDFGAALTEKGFAKVMKDRELTWPQVQSIITRLEKAAEAEANADAETADADEAKASK